MLGSHPKQHNKSNSLLTLLGTKAINSDVLSCERMQVFLGREETCPPMRGVFVPYLKLDWERSNKPGI